MRIEPDKHRFTAPALGLGGIVHTVEVSDARSSRDFLTLFLRGRSLPSDRWVRETGLAERDHHDPAIYHRDDPETGWVLDLPGATLGWTFHYHVPCAGPPTLADAVPFRGGLAPGLWEQLVDHLSPRSA